MRQSRRPATATRKAGPGRARFPTWAGVTLGALAVGALSVAAGLAVSGADKWPGWQRPHHRCGWPAVWVLLAAFVVLAVWQYPRQRDAIGVGQQVVLRP